MTWTRIGACAALIAVSAAIAVPGAATAQESGLSAYDQLVLSHEPAAYWRLALSAAELRSHYAVMTGANIDFNGDGIGDLAAVRKADHTLAIWNGRGSNDFTAAQRVGPGWEPYASSLLCLGDINHNGRTDLAATRDGTLYIWNGKDANQFGEALSRGTGWAGHF